MAIDNDHFSNADQSGDEIQQNMEAELRERLRALLGDGALALIGVDLSLKPEPEKARRKHNARTASYKEAEALRGAPDSEAVRQATSNVLLSIMGLGGESSKGLLTLAMKELIEAGYDQEESRASILRLLADHDELAGNWKRRRRQKLGRVVMAKLQEMNE